MDRQIYVDRLINALRLYRLGSVSTPRYETAVESFSQFAGGTFGSRPRVARLGYELSPADATTLDQAIKILVPILPSSYELPKEKPNFLSTALQWYGEALLAGGPVEGTVAWAVACLEALFLGDNPPAELTYRLAQRVAALLGCFGWASLEIRESVREAYDVRSRYVHGAVSKKLSHEALTALFRKVAEYARVSCLVWIQLQRAQERNEVLKVLDEAMVDDDARVRLKGWCYRIDLARKPC